MRSVLKLLKTNDLSLNEIANIVKDLNVIKLKSDTFYNKIVDYIVKQKLFEKLGIYEKTTFD